MMEETSPLALDPEHDTFIDTRVTVASLGRRLTSVGVDASLVFAGSLSLSLPFGAFTPMSNPLEPDAWARWIESGAWLPFAIGLGIFGVLVQAALPRSPGRLLTGTVLVRSTDGVTVSSAHRWVRAGLALISNLVGGLGTSWILVNPRQRTLYDLLARTVVVRSDSALPASPPPASAGPAER